MQIDAGWKPGGVTFIPLSRIYTIFIYLSIPNYSISSFRFFQDNKLCFQVKCASRKRYKKYAKNRFVIQILSVYNLKEYLVIKLELLSTKDAFSRIIRIKKKRHLLFCPYVNLASTTSKSEKKLDYLLICFFHLIQLHHHAYQQSELGGVIVLCSTGVACSKNNTRPKFL